MFTQAMMLGGAPAGPFEVAISDRLIVDIQVGFSMAKYNLRSTGVGRFYREMDGGYTNIPGEWRLSGVSADYQVRWTHLSGDAPTTPTGPALGAWGTLNLGAEISLFSTTGSLECDVLCEIRRASDSVVLDTATIQLLVDGGA